MSLEEIIKSVQSILQENQSSLVLSSLNGVTVSKESLEGSSKELYLRLQDNINFSEESPQKGDFIVLLTVPILAKGTKILDEERYSDLNKKLEVSLNLEFENNLLVVFKI